jgi:hypothetical protein
MPFKDQTKQKEYMRQASVKRNVKHDCPCGGKYTDKHQARHTSQEVIKRQSTYNVVYFIFTPRKSMIK